MKECLVFFTINVTPGLFDEGYVPHESCFGKMMQECNCRSPLSMFSEPNVVGCGIPCASPYIPRTMALECCNYLAFTLSDAKQVVFWQIDKSVNVFMF